MTQMSMPFGHSTSAVLLVGHDDDIQENEDEDIEMTKIEKDVEKKRIKKRSVMHQHLTVPTPNHTEG